MNVRADLPNGVTSDSGVWVMVTISYFVCHAPWWLGGWSVTYGEQDVFNELWAGSTAQNEYNNFEHYISAGFSSLVHYMSDKYGENNWVS